MSYMGPFKRFPGFGFRLAPFRPACRSRSASERVSPRWSPARSRQRYKYANAARDEAAACVPLPYACSSSSGQFLLARRRPAPIDRARMAVTPPEHRARTRRWGRDGEKRRGRHRRRNRHTGEDAAAREARWERASAGVTGGDDAEKVVVPEPESSPPPEKKLRNWLPSQIGEVFGSLCRVESIDHIIEDHEDEVPAPDGNLDKGKGVVLAPDEPVTPAPAQGGGLAPSSSRSEAAASTVSGVFLAQITVQHQSPPSSSSHQVPAPRDKYKPLHFTPVPAHHPPPASSSRAIATQPPQFPPIPPPQPADDDLERQERLKKRFSGLIAKSEKEIDNLYRENLKRGRAPVVDEETLRRLEAVDAERKRFRRLIRLTEMKVKRDGGLFMHNAPREHVRALGIDAAMERVVSPERPRGGDGKPIVLPEHPCSPVEKLGLFLKLLY